jgi:hypothetical protein
MRGRSRWRGARDHSFDETTAWLSRFLVRMATRDVRPCHAADAAKGKA